MSKLKYSMLTTIDNPYDPIKSFDEWYLYDMTKGYNCCSYLARIANTNDAMSEEEKIAEIDRAIEWIIANDPFNIYKRVQGFENE